MNLQIILPFIVFVVTAFLMYSISNDENKNEIDVIMFRNILPSFVLALLIFAILKYKDSQLFNNEPMMYGNYFD